MKRYYFLVTADEYELPVYIEISWRKLSLASHIAESSLRYAYVNGTVIKNKFKVEVINFP